MAQDRKVFVGGVPQDLNQDDLYAIFSDFAGVKKAWLQKCRTADDPSTTASPQQNHRGFGFVIFHDAHAIDDLLGNASSRFIVLRNGNKLEVKRALSSNKMCGSGGTPAQAEVQQPRRDLQVEATQAQEGARGRGQGPQAGRDAFRMLVEQHKPSLHVPVAGPNAARPPAPSGRGCRLPAQPPVAGNWPGGDAALLRQLSLMHQTNVAHAADVVAAVAAAGFQGQAQALHHELLGAEDQAGALLDSVRAYGSVLSVQPPPGLLGASAADQGARLAPLRDAIVRFYHEHRPEKLTERDFIDFICSIYEGREAELDEALRQKYGTGLRLPLGSMASQLQQIHQQIHQLPHKDIAELANRGRGAAPPPSRQPGNGLGGLSALAAGLGGPYPSPGLQAAEAAAAQAQTFTAAQWYQQLAAGNSAAAATAAASVRRPHAANFANARMDPRIGEAMMYLEGLGAMAGAKSEHEEPDFAWVDQIVGADENGLDMSEEVARVVAGKSAGLQRNEIMQGVVW